mmetsp:Transcript_86345/g.241472  ORF Transcript_86345/g.241472 Transcript_86345/m.241472 type:complete len:203 (+) Transcript_86345:492-1100(+)
MRQVLVHSLATALMASLRTRRKPVRSVILTCRCPGAVTSPSARSGKRPPPRTAASTSCTDGCARPSVASPWPKPKLSTTPRSFGPPSGGTSSLVATQTLFPWTRLWILHDSSSRAAVLSARTPWAPSRRVSRTRSVRLPARARPLCSVGCLNFSPAPAARATRPSLRHRSPWFSGGAVPESIGAWAGRAASSSRTRCASWRG